MNPFLTSIKAFAGLIQDIQGSDRDVVTAVVGDTGEGKSVFLIKLLKELMPDEYNPVRHLPFTRDDLNRMIEQLPEGSGISVDEAVGLFYSRDFHDNEQIALLKKLDRSRDRRLFVGLAIPDFFMLDKALRNGRIRFLVWIDQRVGVGDKGRAHAYLFRKERNVFNREPWNLKLNTQLIRKGQANKSPNYIGEVEYGGLSSTEYGIYKEMKAVKRRLVEMEEWSAAQQEKRRKRPRGGTRGRSM